MHASLAEFELAFKAYDSYVEIITRGKDRVEQSGETDTGIDDDSTVLRTSAEAIRLLCRFGSRKEAEKALEIGQNIEKWLDQAEHIRTASDAGSVASTEATVEPTAIAVAYCAIGISQAHWARLTYQVETRAAIQAKAVQYLRKALSPSLGDSNNVEALYALALVLAETRDIPGAIKVVKRALSPVTRDTTAPSIDGVMSGGLNTEYGRERRLIPLWHLLALLLTSRSDFDAAEKACEAAFEQFGDSSVLFGDDDASHFRSEHLNHATGNDTHTQGLVDRMEGFEKSCILQIKMTQLSLTELVEGAVAAVDGCDKLLALYSRLFGDPTGEPVKPAPPIAAPPPKSAVGTVRGSMFRGRGSVKAPQKDLPVRNSSRGSTLAPNPAIQVTEDDNTRTSGHHRHHLFHHSKHDDAQVGVARSSSKLQKRSTSVRRPSVSETAHTHEVPPHAENIPNSAPGQDNRDRTISPRRLSVSSNPRRSVDTNERTLRPIPHNMSPNSPPFDHGDQLKQDTRLPTPFPHVQYFPTDPRFSKLQERRHKVSLLIDIWVFISTLYTQAQMFDDAKEAVAEALKLAEAFEVESSKESSTAKALAEKGWGGGKSVEELWADAFAAVSSSSLLNRMYS